MPSSEGFVQGYNAQAAVDVESHWVVENHLSQCANDQREIETPAPCPPNADAVTTMAHRLSRDCARDRLRGQGHLCQTKIYRGDGVWVCQSKSRFD